MIALFLVPLASPLFMELSILKTSSTESTSGRYLPGLGDSIEVRGFS